MPRRMPRVCRTPACNGTTHRVYCATCEQRRGRRGADEARPSAAKRGYGRAWRRLRAAKLARDPICEIDGCDQPAVDVHHRVPVRVTGRVLVSLDELLSMCHSHHSQRTVEESREYG